MARARRHDLLTRFLRERPSSTQEDLVRALAAAGEPVTQATVSRDLTHLGAVRGPNGYLLAPANPDGLAAARDRLGPTLRDHAVSIEPAASLIVVRTAPGHSHVVASELDASRPPGMIGCIAGDDTVFLATRSVATARTLASELSAHLLGEDE